MRWFRRKPKPEVRRALHPITGQPLPKTTLISRIMNSFLSKKLRPFLTNWKTSLAGVVLFLDGTTNVISETVVLLNHLIGVADGGDLNLTSVKATVASIAAAAIALFAKDGDK